MVTKVAGERILPETYLRIAAKRRIRRRLPVVLPLVPLLVLSAVTSRYDRKVESKSSWCSVDLLLPRIWMSLVWL